ncbi:MAG TPA: class I SAM-dependent methyltransferase [Candidatus Paceibacterota bacterium]|nr:class I SAM-dependent methyltransferase [Candidatus Paceibacterota bacterium]
MERQTLVTKPSQNYELIDSGGEEKLERYGSVLLRRPDPQALWNKAISPDEWAKADARYVREGKEGKWEAKSSLPKEWPIEFGGLTFLIRPTSFKHTGLFPEQEPNWHWLRTTIESANRPVAVLNLFGYTGGASLAAAQAGGQVTHVDASKTAVAWARENAAKSGLEDKPIRWITEDVMVFVEREIKRGNAYDLILMDPPAFGHGPNDELWKIEEDLLPLLEACEKLLTAHPVGMLINGYAAGYSPLAFAYNLEPFVKKFGGDITYGDLTIEEQAHSTGSGQAGKRALPCGIFARWKA